MSSSPIHWSLPFLQTRDEASRSKTALIILNQPFSKALLRRLWHATDWHCCADGGANRLHDVLNGDSGDAIDTTTTTTTTSTSTATNRVEDYLPDLLKGDLDSVRDDVKRYYETRVSRCSSTHLLLFLHERSAAVGCALVFMTLAHTFVPFCSERAYGSFGTMTSTPRTS